MTFSTTFASFASLKTIAEVTGYAAEIANDDLPKIVDGSFAEACYDMNSIEELYTAIITNDIDEGDCKNWNLSADEYMPQIKLALAHKCAKSL